MSRSPASILFDASGNAVAVLDDTGVYRLRTEAKLATGHGLATESTLTTLATESKLEAVRALLSTIDGDTSNIDVLLSTRATEATLSAFKSGFDARDLASETTLAALKAAFDAEDFSSETTLAALKAAFDAEDFASETTLLAFKTAFDSRDLATETTLAAFKAGFDARDLATETTLAAFKTAVETASDNVIDTINSTVAQLGSGASFAPIGGTDVSQFAAVAVTVHSDQDSALDGMIFEFSLDGTTWDDQYKFNLEPATGATRRFQFPVTAKYFRVNYTNGPTTTTELRIQTILHQSNILTSIHRVEDIVHKDRSAQLTKGVIIAQREGASAQDFYPVQADIQGNLKVTTIGTDIPADPGGLVLMFLENGGSEDLRVDGSTTPVVFEMGPTTTGEVWSARELLLTFAADDFTFDGLSFGPLTKLTNGVSIEVVKDSAVTHLFDVFQNEDFLRLPGRPPIINNTGPKDVLGAALSFSGLILNEADGDVVRITISDNLTSVKIKYFTATLFATKVE